MKGLLLKHCVTELCDHDFPGLEKSPICYTVVVFAWQVTLTVKCTMGKGPGKTSINNKIINQDQQEVKALCKQIVTNACPKDKLKFKVFFEPCSRNRKYDVGLIP